MKRIIARLILVSDVSPNIWDRIKYVWSIFIHFAPVAFALDLVDWWFTENRQFGTFMCIALLMNLGVGAWAHMRGGTFCFKHMIVRNVEMGIVVIVGYTMLEMLRYTAGDNFAGELFRISIQVMTLMFPTSKVLKNIFIISNGKYPPEFIMNKMYNFEKNGDLSKLFGNKMDEEYLEGLVEEKKQKARELAEEETKEY